MRFAPATEGTAPRDAQTRVDAARDALPIVFFDGECVFCNRAARFLMALDRRGDALRYAAMKGEVGRERLVDFPELADVDSIILLEGGTVHVRSDAVLRAFERMGGLWRVLSVLRLIPRSLRDGAYDWLARNRIRWFGRTDFCGLLTPEQRARILD